MHPFLSDTKFAAFAHRGGAHEVPENSLEAFEHAVALGYRYFETDVQLTADGVVVVFHDDEISRLTGKEGLVGDWSWSDLKSLKVNGKGQIPRLEDVLSAWPDLKLNIDAKTDQVAMPLCHIAKQVPSDRLCLASESDLRIKAIREEMGTSICTASATRETALFVLPALAGLPPRSMPAECLQIPPRSRGIPLVTPRQLAAAKSAGKAVHVWTIDDEAEMERLIDLGGDGIMTDRPSLLRGILKRRNLW